MAIEASRKRTLSRLLYSLGIKHIGEKAASILADRFRNIDELFGLTQEKLEAIPEMGPIMAASVIKFFAAAQTKKLIAELKKLGVNTTQEEKIVKKSPITGKTFIFTGELEGLSRNQAQKAVEVLGGKWVSAISKSIDFVVVGKEPGSKYDKAKTLGLHIIEEEEFKKLIGA